MLFIFDRRSSVYFFMLISNNSIDFNTVTLDLHYYKWQYMLVLKWMWGFWITQWIWKTTFNNSTKNVFIPEAI